MNESNKEKVILYISGGTMQGVFGAGVLKEITEANLQDKIEAVYAGSVGSLLGAYFLAGQSGIVEDIFLNKMTDGLISTSGFFCAFWDRIRNRFFPYKEGAERCEALSLKYLFDIMTNGQYALDVNKLSTNTIPLYVKLFNLNLMKKEYAKVEGDIMTILKAAVSIAPYTVNKEAINGHDYIDGATFEMIGTQYFLDKYPNKNIVMIFNSSSERTVVRYRSKRWLEGIMANHMYKGIKKHYMSSEDGLKKDIELVRSHPSIHFVSLPKESEMYSSTTDANILKQAYADGEEAGRKLVIKLQTEL